MRAVLSLLVLLLSIHPAFAGKTPAPIRAEIDALLARLDTSACEFHRNGTWHKPDAAKKHLLRKLEYIEKRTTLRSTEQFIQLAGTSSSASGKPYRVRCKGAAAVPSARWLKAELKKVRDAQAR